MNFNNTPDRSCNGFWLFVHASGCFSWFVFITAASSFEPAHSHRCRSFDANTRARFNSILNDIYGECPSTYEVIRATASQDSFGSETYSGSSHFTSTIIECILRSGKPQQDAPLKHLLAGPSEVCIIHQGQWGTDVKSAPTPYVCETLYSHTMNLLAYVNYPILKALTAKHLSTEAGRRQLARHMVNQNTVYVRLLAEPDVSQLPAELKESIFTSAAVSELSSRTYGSYNILNLIISSAPDGNCVEDFEAPCSKEFCASLTLYRFSSELEAGVTEIALHLRQLAQRHESVDSADVHAIKKALMKWTYYESEVTSFNSALLEYVYHVLSNNNILRSG